MSLSFPLPSRISSACLTEIQSRSSARFLVRKSSPLRKPTVLWSHAVCPPGQANDVTSRFGRRLRLMRQEREMTQTDMARRFGIDRSYISEVERGHKSMTLAMLEVIALGMDISLSKLLENI